MHAKEKRIQRVTNILCTNILKHIVLKPKANITPQGEERDMLLLASG